MKPEARAVRISSTPQRLGAMAPLLEAVSHAAGDVPALLALARDVGRTAPRPGEGGTARLWELLASVTAVDVAAGRVLEPHLDAVAILAQAGFQAGEEGPATRGAAVEPADGAWGVFAAEGPGLRLDATADGTGKYVLNGSKPWCSLAARLDGAVLTAHLADGGRAAFAVDLHAPGVSCETPQWTSRGLREIPSGTVHFDGVSAVPVGGAGWYFQRPGFAWGGMGVAACWFGGAVAVARDFSAALAAAADKGREPDQIALAHLGETDRIITSLAGYLARTAERIDAGELSGSGAWSEALRVRGTVAAAVERVQTVVAQNLGPGPLAFNEAYGKRMADLSLYIRQHHAMRDDAQLGALTLKGDRSW
ncbi:alkylation response protein AidB-like acyl-CoA dehydrogenase [Arthrobacter sp. PvP023]|uniref:acyl-CoA dehydrogenase family protein n=1 Tax=Micrococcaceae TaxID=1268 RepID=UPI001AE25E5A|nr:acyl-CoA dehydrogenase family protein [Arthrobacter sp. PvP023]MBP1137978.1 alkylation response protein AidB-like acyl-CoA dehydrogenase [Arthrobacter sp. PvP023]